MKLNRTTFAFSDKEKEMLDRLCETMGCTPSEFFRETIRLRYMKLFPPYTQKKIKLIMEQEEVTDEQFCEQWGGEVKKSPAGNKCRIGFMEMMVTDRQNIEKRGKELITIKKLKESHD